MTDQPHTPTETTVRYWYIYARRASAEFNLEQVPDTSEAWAEFDRWLATVESAAEQRGAVRHLREVASELNMHHLTEDLSDSALKLGVRFVNLIQDRADRVEGTTSDDND